MAYFWAWLVETDRKKKKRSPRRSRRPVAGKAVTRDRRVYGCCSLPFATSHDQQISTDLLDSHSRWLGGIERRPAFRALAYPASGGTNGFCCRRISAPFFWTFCLNPSHNDNVPMCQVGHDFISSYFRDPFCERHL